MKFAYSFPFRYLVARKGTKMTKRTQMAVVSAALLWCLFGSTAQAVPITWNLLDVLFDDGSVATGSFDFDADLGSYSNIDIMTSLASYGDPNPASPGNADILITVPDDSLADFTGTPVLSFLFDAPLTNAGGLVDITVAAFSSEGTCFSATCSSPSIIRRVESGQVTTAVVPVPTTLVLTVLGLAGLGYRGYYSKRAGKWVKRRV